MTTYNKGDRIGQDSASSGSVRPSDAISTVPGASGQGNTVSNVEGA